MSLRRASWNRSELPPTPEITMATQLSRITIDPQVCHGKPVVRGMRYPVTTLLELLASGMTVAEILADYPDLEPEDLQACLEYAAKLSDSKTAHWISS